MYLNINDKVSPSGLWRDTLALSADVQRHGNKKGGSIKVQWLLFIRKIKTETATALPSWTHCFRIWPLMISFCYHINPVACHTRVLDGERPFT